MQHKTDLHELDCSDKWDIKIVPKSFGMKPLNIEFTKETYLFLNNVFYNSVMYDDQMDEFFSYQWNIRGKLQDFFMKEVIKKKYKDKKVVDRDMTIEIAQGTNLKVTISRA